MMDSTHLQVGCQTQLFVDSGVIEAVRGLTRRWHKPVRRGEPLIRRDRPWERTLYFTYGNYIVLKDPADGLIKCWYEDLGRLAERPASHPIDTRVCYAVSRDGLRFEKPELDVVKIDGRWTNAVMGHAEGGPPTPHNPWAAMGCHSNAVIIDPQPPSPEHRFRTLFTCYRRTAEGRAHQTQCAHSADGIHWRPYEQSPTFGSSGSRLGDISCLFWDGDAGLFVQNTRHSGMTQACWPPGLPTGPTWTFAVAPHRFDLMARRRVFQTRSKDFLQWSELLPISTPDDSIDNLDEAHYGMAQFHVGRMHFGLMGVLQSVDNTLHVRLMHSRDGVRFAAADRAQPLLAPRGSGQWDACMVSMTSPPIEMGGEWWFYHGGSSCHHDWWMTPGADWDAPEVREPRKNVNFCLGLAVLRKEGFASLDANACRGGWLLTRPMLSDGDRLLINARCRPGGSIRVAMLDPQGQPVGEAAADRCDAFTGDSVDHQITWRGRAEVAIPGERWRKLLVELRDAEIFSFRFAKSADSSTT